MRRYSFFTNRECEYFPCHKGVEAEAFNCLFCYCPLYVLGEWCGGDFTYRDNGRKVCTHCTFPHRRESYDAIVSRYEEIFAVMTPPKGDPQKQA